MRHQKIKKSFGRFRSLHCNGGRLSGIKNGKLMSYCAENKFDILLTIDKNLMFQQNLENYPVTIAVLDSLTSKVDELVTFLPSFRSQATSFEKYKAYMIVK